MLCAGIGQTHKNNLLQAVLQPAPGRGIELIHKVSEFQTVPESDRERERSIQVKKFALEFAIGADNHRTETNYDRYSILENRILFSVCLSHDGSE